MKPPVTLLCIVFSGSIVLLGAAKVAEAAGPINICGSFSFLSPATATKPAQLGIDGTTYELVGPGTITPPDISSRVGNLTHPIVRLTGTADGAQVTSYHVMQVETCAVSALPGTSTEPAAMSWWAIGFASAIVLLAAMVRPARRIGRC